MASKMLSEYGSFDFRTAKPSYKSGLVNAIPEQGYGKGIPYSMMIATEKCSFCFQKAPEPAFWSNLRFSVCKVEFTNKKRNPLFQRETS